MQCQNNCNREALICLDFWKVWKYQLQNSKLFKNKRWLFLQESDLISRGKIPIPGILNSIEFLGNFPYMLNLPVFWKNIGRCSYRFERADHSWKSIRAFSRNPHANRNISRELQKNLKKSWNKKNVKNDKIFNGGDRGQSKFGKYELMAILGFIEFTTLVTRSKQLLLEILMCV